jgi:hypothetical protein
VILLSLSAHGATGTWLDEILELGLPLALFAVLWWWSTRKERKKKAKATAEPETAKK